MKKLPQRKGVGAAPFDAQWYLERLDGKSLAIETLEENIQSSYYILAKNNSCHPKQFLDAPKQSIGYSDHIKKTNGKTSLRLWINAQIFVPSLTEPM